MPYNSTQKNLQHSTCKTGHLKLQESYSWIFNHGNNGSWNVIFIIHKVVNIQKETD